ncbi:hypothetical protein K466DRAFT_589553 [Polyporus arcularius HHB13444]|uniref:Uncharacterized protein n=1 Tax=Polyporus arcularius HHB13444 TaxID=1314778 RepID=A0A5C3P314_9APHY|nr:hypothetical protein K466DRAFT_589553 [Polyporus arcularius HHB13444]
MSCSSSIARSLEAAIPMRHSMSYALCDGDGRAKRSNPESISIGGASLVHVLTEHFSSSCARLYSSVMRFIHLLALGAGLLAGQASAAAVGLYARDSTALKTRVSPVARDGIFTVSYCVGNDFELPCVNETSAEPFGTCFPLSGTQFDKTVNSFETSSCTACELFSDDQCTESTSFIASGMSVGNGGAGSEYGPSGVGFFGGNLSSYKCSSTC